MAPEASTPENAAAAAAQLGVLLRGKLLQVGDEWLHFWRARARLCVRARAQQGEGKGEGVPGSSATAGSEARRGLLPPGAPRYLRGGVPVRLPVAALMHRRCPLRRRCRRPGQTS